MNDFELITRWNSEGDDVICDLHEHFEDVEGSFTFWADSAEEANRVFGVLANTDTPEDGSLIHECITAAAASGANVAITQIAKALGVDPYIISVLADSEAINDDVGVVEDVRTVLFGQLQSLGVREPTDAEAIVFEERHGFLRYQKNNPGVYPPPGSQPAAAAE